MKKYYRVTDRKNHKVLPCYTDYVQRIYSVNDAAEEARLLEEHPEARRVYTRDLKRVTPWQLEKANAYPTERHEEIDRYGARSFAALEEYRSWEERIARQYL